MVMQLIDSSRKGRDDLPCAAPRIGRLPIEPMRQLKESACELVERNGVHDSLRATTTDWRYLAGAAGYALLICALGYFTTLVVLRRRQLT